MTTNPVEMMKDVATFALVNKIPLSPSMKLTIRKATGMVLMNQLGVLNEEMLIRESDRLFNILYNEFLAIMGYLPITAHSLHEKNDDIGEYISENWPRSEIKRISSQIDAMEVKDKWKKMGMEESLNDYLCDLMVVEFGYKPRNGSE
jgi:hypothetical protein